MNKQTQAIAFHSVNAGFPSPAEDFSELALNLHEYLIPHPASTFFLRVTGESMYGAGILPDDILIVDRSLTARANNIVVACLDGDFTVKYLQFQNGCPVLVPAHKKYHPIYPGEESDFSIWGVVSGVVRTTKT